MKKQSKSNKNNSQSNGLIRVLVLVPAVFVIWFESGVLCFSLFTGSAAVIGSFVLSGIISFFVGKFILPEYKNSAGIFCAVFCVLWNAFFWYGLSHMAY